MEEENSCFCHRSCKELAGNSSRKLFLRIKTFHRSLPIFVKLSEGKISEVKDRIFDQGQKKRPGQHPGIYILAWNVKGKHSSEPEAVFVKLQMQHCTYSNTCITRLLPVRKLLGCIRLLDVDSSYDLYNMNAVTAFIKSHLSCAGQKYRAG